MPRRGVESGNCYPRHDVAGVILAGGRSTRMGGHDKGLAEVGGRPMVKYVIEAMQPQVDHVLINANRNLDQYSDFGCEVITDGASRGEYLGPLAGMAAGLRRGNAPLAFFAPCDSPFLPLDMVPRLHAALTREAADLAVAHDGKRLQQVFCLLRVTLLDDIDAFLAQGERKVDLWFARHIVATEEFTDAPHAFRNINRPQDREHVEATLVAQKEQESN